MAGQHDANIVSWVEPAECVGCHPTLGLVLWRKSSQQCRSAWKSPILHANLDLPNHKAFASRFHYDLVDLV